jgi:hypothetical protein
VSRHYIDIGQRLAKAKNRWAVFLWRKNAKNQGWGKQGVLRWRDFEHFGGLL